MKKLIKKLVPFLMAVTLIFTIAAVDKVNAKDYNCTNPKLQQLINEWDGVY